MKLEKVLFERYFTNRDKRDDINKNAEGKGTLERYMEIFGADVDNSIVPWLLGLLDAVINPYTAESKYLGFMESYYGYDEKNRTLYMGPSDRIRRALVRIMPKLLTIRGTRRALEILFKMIGIEEVTIIESITSFGFDSDTTLDSDVRRFDSFEQDFTSFGLVLTSSTIEELSDELLEIIRSIILFNMPINAKWEYLIFNGVPVNGVVADFNTDYNRDYAT